VKKVINQILFLFIIVYICIFALYKSGHVSYEFLNASFYAGVINGLNAVATVLSFNYALGKSGSLFMIYNMGGMVARMFILLIVILILLKFLNIDKYGFIFIFFILYFISLALEINYFRIQVTEKKS